MINIMEVLETGIKRMALKRVRIRTKRESDQISVALKSLNSPKVVKTMTEHKEHLQVALMIMDSNKDSITNAIKELGEHSPEFSEMFELEVINVVGELLMGGQGSVMLERVED